MIHKGYEHVPYILPDSPEQYTPVDYATASAFSFHQLFKQKCVVAVADLEKYRVYLPGKSIDHKLKAGDKLIEGSVMFKAINSRTRVSVRNDSSLFGFPYIGTAFPIFNEAQEVIGGIIFCENIQLLEELTTAAENLHAMTARVVNMVASLENANQNLDDIGTSLKTQSIESLEKFQSTDAMLELIKGIAGQTKVLGINASIEASRAGQAGAGFNVVAREIRKLSDESMQSVQTISETLNTIRQTSEAIDVKAKGIGDAVGQQTSIVQELAAVMQHLHSIAESLQTQAAAMVDE